MKSFSHQKSILKKSLFRPHRIQTKFPRIRSLGFPENCKTIFYKLRFNPHHRCLKSQLIFRQNDFSSPPSYYASDFLISVFCEVFFFRIVKTVKSYQAAARDSSVFIVI